MEQQENIIQVHDLRKSYGDLKAVDGISFGVSAGEVFGILGPNGAGKTTTVEILEGMRAPDSGIAVVNGIDVQKNPRAVKKIIGIQLQSSAFFDRLSLVEILDVMASLYHRQIDALVLLRDVELDDRSDALFKELSGGQKQRFSVASTLVNDPILLFLDEPTTGLDPQARRHMWELVQRFKSEGRTVLLTTHYMEEAEELCDRVAIMDHGKIVAMDRPTALVDSLLSRGFQKERTENLANLEDVFLDLTGRALRDE
ncbi:MAG: ABC transporter ATP-binding protein [SAR202 cluster bacterium]|uniref:ABC transporter, ATP-binding protein n=1 Tax=hydrothermal vent metagenome TaxID=652676 RepID=A0A160VCG2_9ZZZZ|nr:ABC transporter ATP-binding protein [SAR202 cluster bacterium]MQG65050.1 ABC transporter ATP-binding protein [SAR202 cluster bacterium]|tara:strand:- start:884 stop:1651 length:768 start_codon:yes stop_codon:yes gene_type:complete